jgi:peptide/nickel transport system substrate-binding protein
MFKVQMNGKTVNLLLLLIISCLIISCSAERTKWGNRVVIGVIADVQTFNALFAFSYEESVITEELYPGLVQTRWNEEKGELEPFPLIAERWEWSNDSSSVRFFMRDDVYWSDGRQLTAEDVLFSYDMFSDPDVQSRLYRTFSYFHTKPNGHIEIEKAFRVISPFELEVNLPKESIPNLKEFDLTLIPKHVFETLDRKKLANDESNFNPVTCGAYRLKKWERNQSITLQADSNSFLFRKGQIAELVFKIIPDYNSRLLQLEKGEIDFMDAVKVEDVERLKKNDNLAIVTVFGRDYDYIGWNHIDPQSYSRNILEPNKFFGNSNVRKALSMAINREEIFEEYLHGLGALAASPVSPVFKSAFNEEVKPYEYDPAEAKRLLALEGWKDEDDNGVLEKNKQEFRFKLYYPAGNPLREFASVVIKNNLKSVGIEVKPERMELGTFIENLYKKKNDAWMAGWGVSMNLKLKRFWYSDPEVTSINFMSYSNKEADEILDELDTRISHEKRNELIKKLQMIIHQDEPVTFLYWTPNVVVYNKRIKNPDISPYSVIVNCREWRLGE